MNDIETILKEIERRDSALAQCEWTFQVDHHSPNGRDECSIWRGDKKIVGSIRGPQKAAKICEELEQEKSARTDIPRLVQALRRAIQIMRGEHSGRASLLEIQITKILQGEKP